MKQLIFSLLIVTIAPLVQARELSELPGIGEFFQADEKGEIAVPFLISSNFYCVHKIRVNRIEYLLYTACNFEKSKESKQPQKIRFIESHDPAFMTPEGHSVGKIFNETISNASYGDECKKLPSGWHACVETTTDNGSTEFGSRISRFIK